MADLKISALTSATTPLAGTEVLPMVQSSTTVKVATNDLTVRNVRANATTGILQVTGPGTGTTRVMTTPDANFTAARTDAAQSFTGIQTLLGSGGQSVRVYGGSAAHQWDIYGNGNNLRVGDNTGGGLIQFDTDLNMNGGNLIQGTAAKGINFTANTPAAGMTSQLLNWYEEGTWTGTLTVRGSGTAGTYTPTAASTFATYTRVGRLVTLQLQIGGFDAATSGTGDLNVTGLPFTKAANSGYTATVWLFNATFPALTSGIIGRPSTSAGTSSTMEFYALVTGGGTTIPISAIATNTQLSFNVSYIV